MPDVLRHLALEQVRNAHRELNHFDTASDFTQRIVMHLAMFRRNQRCDAISIRFQQIAELVQDTGATQRRRASPFRKCSPGGSNRRIHIAQAGQTHIANRLTERRIKHRSGTLSRACRANTVDEMLDFVHS